MADNSQQPSPEQKPNEQQPEQKPAEQQLEQQPTEQPAEQPSEQKQAETTEQKPTENELPPKEEDKSKLGQVTSLVEQAGLSMKEVAEVAKSNDGKLDLETMVALKEKHGDAIASLLADQIESIHKERTSAATKRDQEVYDQVKEAFKDTTEQSGEETWKELAGWAKDNVSIEHRTDINKMLAQGGLAAKLAVQEMVTAFKESQGTQEFQEADLIEADTVAKQDGGNITKQDYNLELNKLLAAGHQYGSSTEIAKLDARRMKSMQRGV